MNSMPKQNKLAKQNMNIFSVYTMILRKEKSSFQAHGNLNCTKLCTFFYLLRLKITSTYQETKNVSNHRPKNCQYLLSLVVERAASKKPAKRKKKL